MAWRGGRGGSRGGRFGGRGSTAAVAKDDDGQIMGLEKRDGPPPLYPPVSLPELPDIGQSELQLLSYRRKLERFFLSSPYFLDEEKKKKDEILEDLLLYNEFKKHNSTSGRAPLNSVLKMSMRHFPAELIGTERKKKKLSTVNPFKIQGGEGTDLKRLELLEKFEKKSEKEGESAKEGDEKKKNEEMEGDEEEEGEEEEELDDDDYAQAFGFDDDDGYEDFDDGGDDEGAVY